MKNWFHKMDWILIMRLIMGGSMIIVGYQAGDYTPATVGMFFVIYSLVSAKYKIGCGYNASCGTDTNRRYSSKTLSKKEIEYTEIN